MCHSLYGPMLQSTPFPPPSGHLRRDLQDQLIAAFGNLPRLLPLPPSTRAHATQDCRCWCKCLPLQPAGAPALCAQSQHRAGTWETLHKPLLNEAVNRAQCKLILSGIRRWQIKTVRGELTKHHLDIKLTCQMVPSTGSDRDFGL